mgnify:FL=1
MIVQNTGALTALLDEIDAQERQKLSQEQLDSMSIGDTLTTAVTNIPSSAVQLLADITLPIRHPIETAESLISLGKGIYQLTTPGEQADEKTARAVGEFFADRYGSLDGFKNAFATDPLGVASDISVVLKTGSLLAKVPKFKNTTTDIIGDTLSTTADYIDPVLGTGKLIQATTSGVGKGSTFGLGVATGSGSDALKIAFESGKAGGDAQAAFLANLRGQASGEEVLTQAFAAFKEQSKQKAKDYKTGMDVVKGAQKKVDFKGIEKVYGEVKADFTIKTKKGDILKGGATLQAKFDEIEKLINQWKNNPELHLAENVDALKQAVDSLYVVGKDGIPVTRVRNAIHEEIVRQVPEYADTMRAYEQAVKLEKEIMKELSLNKTAAAGTTLRKLQSVMRNNVNTNYGNRMEMLRNLDPDLLPALAGQALSSATPRGLQGMTFTGQMGAGAFGYADPLTLAVTLPAQSPRLMGELYEKLGRVSRFAKPVTDLASSPALLPTARTTRLIGEIDRAGDFNIPEELKSQDTKALEELLKEYEENVEETKEILGFNKKEINDIRSEALTLKEDTDEEDDEIIYSAEGGIISAGPSKVVSDILEKYKSVVPQGTSQALELELVSLQRLLNQTNNQKFKDQIYQKLGDYQKRLQANINKSVGTKDAQTLDMMQGLSRQSINENIEENLAKGDTDTINQLLSSKSLYQDYMNITDDKGVEIQKDKASDIILSQITDKNYDTDKVINLLFAHNKLAPNNSVPLAISKLRNQTSDAEYNVVESKLKDGITLKAFVADEKNKNATDLSKNFTSTIKTQKNVIDEIFNPDEVKKMQQFKSKALPSISNEIKDNPEDTKFIVASALDKRELLKNGAKQTLDNLQEPLIEKQTEEVMTESTPTETEPVAEKPVATESLQTSIDNFRVPSVGGNMFTPQQTLNPQLMLSPTVLPNEDDREIAMRQQMGIAGLV